MKAVQSVVFAALVALVANVSFGEGVLPKSKRGEFAGVITVKMNNKVQAYALASEHKAILEEAKAVAEQIEAGKMEEDSDDALAVEKKLEALIAAKKGIKLLGSTEDGASKLAQVSEKSAKACFGFGAGWGYCGVPYFYYGCYQPAIQQVFTYVNYSYAYFGGWGRWGCWW